jgi:sigma-B regulation protein RsbU (phosphoserine phosphatase)
MQTQSPSASSRRKSALSRARRARQAPGSRSMLRFLAESAEDLGSSLDLHEVFRKIAERVRPLIDHELFCLMLWDERKQSLEHCFSLCHGEAEELPPRDMPLGQGITGSAALARRPIRVSDVAEDGRYIRYPQTLLDVRSELAVPLIFQNRLVGVLDLESIHPDAFTEAHEQILLALASQMASALLNARLFESVRARERKLEEELSTASEIQRGLLPSHAPRIPGLEIGIRYAPAAELCGDFYDLVPSGDGRLGLLVGDVAGKSTPAALFGSLAVGLLRGRFLQHFEEPAALLAHMNEQLRLPRVRNRFLALAYGVYDARDHTLSIANAGFPWPLLARGGVVSRLKIGGTPLGAIPGWSYDQEEIEIRPQDVVAFCSDGVTDCESPSGDRFGEERLERVLGAAAGGTAHDIAGAILAAVVEHAGDARSLGDDCTILVAKRNGEPGGSKRGMQILF